MIESKKIGFIGGGNMAEALIKGLIDTGVSPENIKFHEPSVARREHIEKTYGLVAAADNPDLATISEILILAIKPQVVREVLPTIRDVFGRDHLLISLLAGVPTGALQDLLGGNPRVVRAMPNTPALVAAGAAAVCSGAHVKQGDLDLACEVFRAVGTVAQVAEKQMDAVTGLSGSGPAYVYTFIEALTAGGVQEGLPPDVAHLLAVQTVLGAAQLVMESGEHPAQLREKVCSPGGTTIAGIRTLEERGLRSALTEAVSAATRRSRELGQS